MWKREAPKSHPVWLLVSGPSGVGKTTLIEQMLGFYYPQLQPVVTATTRPIRAGEEEGKQYFFLTRGEFEKRQAAGEFLETHAMHGNWYGIPKNEVKKRLDAGSDLIMHVTWQGRQKLLELAKSEPWMKRAMASIFVKPESMEALKQRLERRGRNTPEEIEMRLKIAEGDLPHAESYDYEFYSGTYDQDFQQMKAIYLAEKARIGH
mgnify:CR=1 FL=1